MQALVKQLILRIYLSGSCCSGSTEAELDRLKRLNAAFGNASVRKAKAEYATLGKAA